MFAGFCLADKFNSNKTVGEKKWSIGIVDKMHFRHNDVEKPITAGSEKEEGFDEGDVIGIGIGSVGGTKAFFASLNGKNIGMLIKISKIKKQIRGDEIASRICQSSRGLPNDDITKCK